MEYIETEYKHKWGEWERKKTASKHIKSKDGVKKKVRHEFGMLNMYN